MQRLLCARDRILHGRCIAGLALALFLVSAAGAAAAPAPAPQTDPEATATAILNQVVDGLWERSDRFFHLGDYETTSRINRLVIRMDPNFVEGINTLAWLLRQGMQRPREALALHYRAVRDNPQSWEANLDLGMFYFDYATPHLNRRTRILAALDEREDKESADAARQRAEADAELQKASVYLERAIPYLRAVLTFGGPSSKQHLLAHALEKMGRRAEAMETWRQIIEKFPDDQPARRNLERLEKEE